MGKPGLNIGGSRTPQRDQQGSEPALNGVNPSRLDGVNWDNVLASIHDRLNTARSEQAAAARHDELRWHNGIQFNSLVHALIELGAENEEAHRIVEKAIRTHAYQKSASNKR